MRKINILFLIKKNKINKQGECSITCRITYENKRKPFSTGLFISPNNWDAKGQKAKPPNTETTFINSELSLIKNKINQAFLFLQVQEREFTAEDIYNQYAGVPLNVEKTVLDVFDQHIVKQKKLIGIETSEVSVAKFHQTRKHVESYIKFKYKKNDYFLKHLKSTFITDFEFYLKTEKKFMPHTIYKTIQRFRQIVKIAVAKDYIHKDPFMLHKNPKPKKDVVFLTPRELETLSNHTFSQKRLESVRDMFVFCCYTGLAYNEMSVLEKKNVEVGFDGVEWIKIVRKKTSREVSVPLLSKAKEILAKYENEYETLLPVISNQKFNSYLKEIGEIVGINKNLTHHLARKTFATTVLLYNDVPMEIVSELLGHSEMSVTQAHYGKIVKSKVSEHMMKLSKKLDKGRK